MVIKTELSQAIERWERTKEHPPNRDKWQHFKPLLLGSPTDIPKASGLLHHDWWKDAVCSLLQIDSFGNLRLHSTEKAQHQISTILFLRESAQSVDKHPIKKLVREGYFRRLILQLCTKQKFSRLSPELYNYLYEVSTEMVRIPGGTYWIGSAQTYASSPYHNIKLKEYQISRYAVTQLLWQHVMGQNPSKFKGVSRPVEQVSWYNAVSFCNKMSEQNELEAYYEIKGEQILRNPYANGYRLPNEAQWEAAARGEKSYGRAKSESPSEIDVSQHGWVSQKTGTRPIGQKEANAFGLYDAFGNVNEWCWDLFSPFSRIVQEKGVTLPYFERIPHFLHGYMEGYYRSVRGGCWNLGKEYALPYRRMANQPNLKSPSIGLRICKP